MNRNVALSPRPCRRKTFRVFSFVLKAAALAAALLSIQACDLWKNLLNLLQCRQMNAASSEFAIITGIDPYTEIHIELSGKTPAPGGEEHVFIQGHADSAEDNQLMDYYWSPPFGNVNNITFSVPPENPQGPPPYRWMGLRPTGNFFAPVSIRYRYPETDQAMIGHESVQYDRYTDGLFDSTCTRNDVATRKVLLSPSPQAPAPLAGQLAKRQHGPQAERSGEYLYYTGYYHAATPMTPEVCRAYAEALSEGRIFFAVQTPTVGMEDLGGFVRTSVLPDRATVKSRIELTNYPANTAGFSGAVIEAPQYINALENAFPSPEGMMWTPLLLDSRLVDDNCGAFTGAEGWMLQLKFIFEKTLEDSTLQSYFCYAGESPFVIEALRQKAGTSGMPFRQAATAAEPCLTCLGPNPVILKQYGDIVPDLACSWYNLAVQPDGRRINFWHMAYNVPGPCSLGVSYNQTPPGPLGWSFYEDKGMEPDLTKPITSLDANKTFWVVSDPVDGAVVPGEYAIMVSLTPQGAVGSPAWASDSAWVFPLHGDVNGDKVANALDLALLANYLAANTGLGGHALLAADFNQDGAVDALDSALLRKAFVGH